MKNFKHSLIAVIAVAMISSLAVAQASGLNDSKTEREQRINAAAAEQSITSILQTQLKVLPRFQQNLQRLLLKIQQKKAKSRQRVFTLLAMYLSQTVHLT